MSYFIRLYENNGPSISLFCRRPQYHLCLLTKHSLIHGAEPFLRSCQLCSYLRNSQHFIEPESSSWCASCCVPALSTIHIAHAQNHVNINLRQNHIITGTHWQYTPEPTLNLIYEFQGDDDHHTKITLKQPLGATIVAIGQTAVTPRPTTTLLLAPNIKLY
jgi:hypothetical protein